MSHEELSDSVISIIKQLNAIKRWWPVAVIFGMIIGGTFSAAGWWFKFDNSIVKKPDVVVTNNKLDVLSRQMSDMNLRFKYYIIQDSVKHKIVTLEVDSNKKSIVILKKKYDKIAYYIGHYSYSTGKRVITLIPVR